MEVHTQACDVCRRRKVRCDQLEPCRKCTLGHLECTYKDRVKRKTVNRRNTAPVLAAFGQQSASSHGDATSVASLPPVDGRVSPTPVPTPPASVLDHRLARPPAARLSSTIGVASALFAQIESFPQRQRISSQLLSLHVKLFLRFMYPLWPVLRPKDILDACANPEHLTPRRYALLLAICAATNVQLKLSATHMLSDLPDDTVSELYTIYTQDYLLGEAIKTRNTLNIAEEPDIDNLLTSCFLFSCYANLERHNEAWFYLSQTVSFVISLQLHDEASYASFSIAEAEMRSRIFWLVFVLERAYCLHNKRPVMLYSTAPKPSVTFPDDPGTTEAFLIIVSIFEAVPPTLYNWLCTPYSGRTYDVDAIPSCYWSLSKVSLFPENAVQSQLVNIAITKDWLKTYLWHIALKYQIKKPTGLVAPLPLEAPISAAKSVMTTISSVSQRSMEVHGIGMERKLFDVGSYILDYLSAFPTALTTPTSTATSSKELLWGIMLSLSKMRGSQASLLTGLLDRSKDYLSLSAAGLASPLLPPLGDEDVAEEEFYTQTRGGSAEGQFQLSPAGDAWG